MFKLIKLEWQKHKISKYIAGAAILIAVLAIFNLWHFWGLPMIPQQESRIWL